MSSEEVIKPRGMGEVVWTVLCVIFAMAYVAATVCFAVIYHNTWATIGFAYVVILICVRVAMGVIRRSTLIHAFPPNSSQRLIYQLFFFLSCLVCFALSMYLLAYGLKRYERWDGYSSFCAMISWMMACKWSAFVTIPMHRLRADVLYPDLIYKLNEVANTDLNSSRESDEDIDEKFINEQMDKLAE